MAGTGVGFTVGILRHSIRKREKQARPDLRNTAPVLDPTGFDPAVARQKHGIGLSSMEERVRLLNGKILIQSQPNAGTTVHVSIPASEAGDNSIMSKLPQFSTEQV